jgi:hypothetical protein
MRMSASLSLRTSRTLDAARLCCFAAMVCVADVVMRKTAQDFPSPVSMHYNARCVSLHAFQRQLSCPVSRCRLPKR